MSLLIAELSYVGRKIHGGELWVREIEWEEDETELHFLLTLILCAPRLHSSCCSSLLHGITVNETRISGSTRADFLTIETLISK